MHVYYNMAAVSTVFELHGAKHTCCPGRTSEMSLMSGFSVRIDLTVVRKRSARLGSVSDWSICAHTCTEWCQINAYMHVINAYVHVCA
jgi:hypothetical protein